MSKEERLQLEQECLLKYSKAQMINKYIDEFEENSKLSELWCKSQQENKQLKEKINIYENPDDMTLMFMWCDEKAKDKIKELQQENKQLKEELENIKDFNNKLQASKDRLDKDDYNLAHILAELEEWCNDGIKDELIVFDYGTEIIGEPIKIHIASYEMVLDKIQKLKEKYK